MIEIRLLMAICFLLLPTVGILACSPAVLDTKYFGKITGFPSDEITAITSDAKRTVFVGTKDRGLVLISSEKGQWTNIFDETKSLSFNAVHSLWHDQDNSLWIGTAGGLNYMDTSSISIQSKYYADDGLKDNIVLSIVRDPAGSKLYIGTTSGLVTKEAWFQRITEKDGLVSNIIQSLLLDRNGDLWVGTSLGLMVKAGIYGYKKMELNAKDSAISDWVYGLAATVTQPATTGSGAVQIGDYRKKLKRTFEAMAAGVHERLEKNGGLEKAVKAEMERFQREAESSMVYAATNNGIFAVDKGTSTGEKMHDGWFTAITRDKNGRVFAANTNLEVVAVGLNAEIFPGFQVGKMISHTLKDRIKSEVLGSDESKDDGLLAIDQAVLRKLREMPEEELDAWITKNLLSKSITSLHMDNGGNLWVGLEQGGLFRFHPEIVNQDSFYYGLKYNHAAGGEINGLHLKTAKVPYPKFEQIAAGIAKLRAAGNVPDIWIGRWSELGIEDCAIAAEFVGKWSHPACVINLMRFLAFDPYVIIPLDKERKSVK